MCVCDTMHVCMLYECMHVHVRGYMHVYMHARVEGGLGVTSVHNTAGCSIPICSYPNFQCA